MSALPDENDDSHLDTVIDYAFSVQKAFFDDGYPLPFVSSDLFDWGSIMQDWGDAPRVVVELDMCQLSATLRNKPNWQNKINDPAIRSKWREEALAADEPERPEWKLTEKMVDYVLDEMHGYAKLIDEPTGIQVGCYERVWQSDRLVPDEIRSGLLAGVAELENVPEEEKDWHPGSDGKVLDLVHPSLYPIVYNRTVQRAEATGEVNVVSPPDGSNEEFLSKDFAWLPSDFAIGEDGSAKLVSPYINNLHPEVHKKLYPVLDKLVALAVPMWERVLSDLQRPATPFRIATRPIYHENFGGKIQGVDCVWDSDPPYPSTEEEEDLYDNDPDAFYATQDKDLPEALTYSDQLDATKKTISLSDQTIQVIVKLANIHLTPEKPSYPGGAWHVEGMENETIVSTFIYYYDQENVTDSHLWFRNSVNAPIYHGQDDTHCIKILYNMGREDPQCQTLGGVETRNGRCIAFPNIYQHQVQPFELEDETKPGHRKILAFFLIDPSRNVPSATTVPLQRRDWVLPKLCQTLSPKFPLELVDLIVQQMDNLMDLEDANEIREKLMKERSRMVQENSDSAFGVKYSMCEH